MITSAEPKPMVTLRRNNFARKLGKKRPATSHLLFPKPPLGDFTTVIHRTKPSSPKSGGFIFSDHCGASSFASALGNRSGCDPGTVNRYPNTSSSIRPYQQDISIWQRLGHFYLALTPCLGGCRRQMIMS